jgi:DNA replication protein DnaC
MDHLTTQDQVFGQCGKDLCESFLKGKNCNIIVYGPTSTGKTFTMQGTIKPKNINLK